MCEKELLVAYLYDDLADGDRATFESHLRGCAECRDELKALRGVRADLASWSPPQPDFGFRVVRGGRDAAERDDVRWPPPRSWRAWWTPAAGLAAAAVLVLAAAASLAHVEVHRGPDGITVRTGWSTSPSAVGPLVSAGIFGDTSRDIRLASTSDAEFLAGIERRLNALEASSRDSGLRNASMLSARSSDAEILKQFREILAQSETKQQGELALRIAQVWHDVDAQRANDLARINQVVGRIDRSVAGEADARRDLTNLVISTAAKQR